VAPATRSAGGMSEPRAELELEGAPPPAFTLVSVRRRLLRGSTWVLGGKLISIPLGFVINALIARLLTPSEVGAYFATFTLVSVGSIVAQLGLDRAAVRFVSTALSTGDQGRARRVIRIVFVVGSIASLATGLVLVLGLGGWLARSVFHSPVMQAAIPVAAGWLVVTALQSLVVETFRGFQLFGLATAFDSLAANVFTAVAFGVLLARQMRPSLTTVVALSLAFAAAAAVVSGALLIRRVRTLRGDGTASRREIFSMAWPVLFTDISIYLLGTGVDLLVLGAFRPLSEVALYGAASRLMMLVVTPYRVLQGVVPPIIAELYAKGRKRELERALRASAAFAGIPAFIALIAFLLFGGYIMGTLYGPFYRDGATVLAILSAGRLVAVWTGSCGLALMMTGHQKAMMYITIVWGVTSITGEILVAPHFGGVGVATTTACTAAAQNLAQLFLARRLVGVSTQAELNPKVLLRFIRARDSAGEAEPRP
jgi:O-antigen/teichoic acid export membrane protein